MLIACGCGHGGVTIKCITCLAPIDEMTKNTINHIMMAISFSDNRYTGYGHGSKRERHKYTIALAQIMHAPCTVWLFASCILFAVGMVARAPAPARAV